MACLNVVNIKIHPDINYFIYITYISIGIYFKFFGIYWNIEIYFIYIPMIYITVSFHKQAKLLSRLMFNSILFRNFIDKISLCQ